MTLVTYMVQQFSGKDWNIFTVKASSAASAKKAAIAKGANPDKPMSVRKW